MAIYSKRYQKVIRGPSPEPQGPGGVFPEYSSKKHHHEKSQSESAGVAALDTSVGLRKKNSQPLLLEVMALDHPFEYFDIRERVFGVLSLVTDAASFHTVVDYGSSIEVVFCAVLEHHMEHASKELSAFLQKTGGLARQLDLDLLQCLEVKGSSDGSRSAFLGPFTYTRDRNPFMFLSRSVSDLGAVESKVQLRRTSQTLRKVCVGTTLFIQQKCVDKSKLRY